MADSFIGCANKALSTKHYSGGIWCPSVETGFWVAERDGLMFITGNTLSSWNAAGLAPLTLLTAADLQDSLMVASNDLDRLQRLLTDATETLMGHFYGATTQLQPLLRAAARQPELPDNPLHRTMQHLAGAVTALQFQDLASQLVNHTQRRLRHCADCLARDVMGDDDDGDAVVEAAPQQPNPVTQDEMDAGSIELF